MAVNRAPKLRSLVWAPSWRDAREEELLPGGRLHPLVAGYRKDILSLLRLESLTILLMDGRCLRFESLAEQPRYVPVASDCTNVSWRD